MTDQAGALASAAAQVAAVRDDPTARLALMARVFRGPTGRAPRHLPFRRAALSFMRWQARRGVLNRLDASPTHGPSSSDTYGALRTCRSPAGYSNASHGLDEAGGGVLR
jgi:hypothetical protein